MATIFNILLNSKAEKFVSDFDKARLLDPESFNQTLVAGTCGYIAPGELFFSYYILYLSILQHIILKSLAIWGIPYNHARLVTLLSVIMN